MQLGLFYASMSGNTLALVEAIGARLQTEGHETSLHDMLETHPKELGKYELVIAGVSTYDEGLNAVAQLFLDTARVESVVVSGSRAGVISLGDSIYPDFATGGETMAKGLEAMGMETWSEVFTVDGEVGEQVKERGYQWARSLIEQGKGKIL